MQEFLVCSISPCFLTAQEQVEQLSLSKSAPQSRSKPSGDLDKGHGSKNVHKMDEMTVRDTKVGRASNLIDSRSNNLFVRHIPKSRQSKVGILIRGMDPRISTRLMK